MEDHDHRTESSTKQCLCNHPFPISPPPAPTAHSPPGGPCERGPVPDHGVRTLLQENCTPDLTREDTQELSGKAARAEAVPRRRKNRTSARDNSPSWKHLVSTAAAVLSGQHPHACLLAQAADGMAMTRGVTQRTNFIILNCGLQSTYIFFNVPSGHMASPGFPTIT